MKLQAKNRIPLILSAPLGLMALVGLWYALRLGRIYGGIVLENPDLREAFRADGIPALVRAMRFAFAGLALLFAGGCAAGLMKRPWSLKVLRKAYAAVYAMISLYIYAITRVIDVMCDNHLEYHGQPTDRAMALHWKQWLLAPAIVAIIVFITLHAIAWMRSVRASYAEPDLLPQDGPASAKLRRGDPVYRRSILNSLVAHVMIIIVFPWLMQSRGCSATAGVEEYLLPGFGGGGSGGGGAKMKPAVVKIKNAPKHRKFILNPNSAISFHVPTIDESEVLSTVAVDTENTYVADPNDVFLETSETGTGSGFGEPGGQGTGVGHGPGKGSGWPGGSKEAVFRFIRIQYRGDGWDDGMDDVSGADRHFLEKFRQITKFKAKSNGEAYSIAQLHDEFKPGRAPPFVYMTGKGAIDLSSVEVAYLRQFLMSGSMLWADCGSAEWDRQFRELMRRVFPDKPFVDISNDDPIYRYPFHFPNGAPPMWHLGGSRAMGIKDKERWLVYYFPGHMGAAWKTGRSGTTEAAYAESIRLGINLVCYSFTQYIDATAKYRK